MTAPGGKAWRRMIVANTPEVQRIRALPRRAWKPEDVEKLVRDMTELLKTPDGTMTLRPAQAIALYEILTYGGLAAPIKVGGGKTLISLLAALVLQSKRPMLMLPASLIGKTQRELMVLSNHWKVPRNIRMFSYQMLGREQAANTLEFYRPDLLVLDEAHRAKNPKAGVTRRLVRYMREHPDTRVVVMSGTLVSDSLMEFAHLLRWALKDGAPVPATDGETREWADALDEKINPFRRADAGALLTLGPPEDGDDETAVARRVFRSRLLATPGVVSTTDNGVNCSLYISAVQYPVNEVTEQNFRTLRGTWTTPDGWALSEAVAVWRHARELALGMHYVWDPRPPEEWLMARRTWARFVRDTLSRSRHLDTELQVAHACQKGALDDMAFRDWARVRPAYTPAPKAVWHDDSALKVCQEWLAGNDGRNGIVWTEHAFFARELSRRTGVPYFGAQGLDARGNYIEDASGPVIASIKANSTGRNLQHKWSRNLITSCPTKHNESEQLIGRTHRDGQPSDEVHVEILFGCWEHFDAFEKAKGEAKMSLDLIGDDSSPPKLLIADLDWPTDMDVARLTGARWTKTVEREPLPI